MIKKLLKFYKEKLSFMLEIKKKIRKTLNYLKNKSVRLSEWMNANSSIEQSSFKVSAIKSLLVGTSIITLLCFSFTHTYYETFGVHYFLHFDYLDIYNFTLGRLSVFFKLILLSLFVPIAFLGFFIGKDDSENYFSNSHILILRLSFSFPILFALIFVFEYSQSFYSLLIAFFVALLIVISFFKHSKVKHDIFLFVIVMMILVIGISLGKTFAKERLSRTNFIELVNNSNKNTLTKDEIVIGQNKTVYIVFNKNDSIVEFISKSKINKVRFKGEIKINPK